MENTKPTEINKWGLAAEYADSTWYKKSGGTVKVKTRAYKTKK